MPSWWNPVTWYDDAKRDLPSDVGQLGDYLLKKVVALGNLVKRDVTDVFDDLSDDVLTLDHDVSNIEGELLGIFATVGGVAGRAASAVRDEITRLVDEALSGVRTAIDDVSAALTRGIAGAESYALHAVDNFYHAVIVPALHDAEHDAEHAFADVAADAAKAVYWIDHDGMDAVHLILKAADWIEWMALHSVDEVEHLPEAVARALSPHKLESELVAAGDKVSELESTLESWLHE